jgi:outer membrane protein OmpA-like peptidoglycan-associated protein
MRRFVSSRSWFGAAALALLAGCAPQPSGTDAGRFLVFFDEFSANLTADAKVIIADAAKTAKAQGARAVRIEGRASATGSPEANRSLAQTRTQVVADELAKDGIAPAMVKQAPIGQTGSGDAGVTERRVDIVLEK